MNCLRQWMPDIVILGMIGAALLLPSLNARATHWLPGAAPEAALRPGGMTDLMSAAAAGDAQEVQLLLSRGADPNAVDQNGNTALFFAAMFDRAAVARVLMDQGADPAWRNSRDESVMDRVIEYRAWSVDEQLAGE